MMQSLQAATGGAEGCSSFRALILISQTDVVQNKNRQKGSLRRGRPQMSSPLETKQCHRDYRELTKN